MGKFEGRYSATLFPSNDKELTQFLNVLLLTTFPEGFLSIQNLPDTFERLLGSPNDFYKIRRGKFGFTNFRSCHFNIEPRRAIACMLGLLLIHREFLL
jgi:hypothetical protein